jgi:hypothetical protein
MHAGITKTVQIEVDDSVVVEIDRKRRDHLGMCWCIDDFPFRGLCQSQQSHSCRTCRKRVHVELMIERLGKFGCRTWPERALHKPSVTNSLGIIRLLGIDSQSRDFSGDEIKP